VIFTIFSTLMLRKSQLEDT